MEDPFIITITYKGKERDFEAELLQMGYTHKFHVIVEGADLFFERDEEGSYRAILRDLIDPSPGPNHNPGSSRNLNPDHNPNPHLSSKHPDAELLRLIAEKIESILA